MQKNFSRFKTKNSPTSNITILFGCCDIGETNALLPIINTLIAENEYHIDLITKNPATELIKRNTNFIKSHEIDPNPTLIITGYSKDSEIQNYLLTNAKEKNIPIILIEDFPGNFIRYKQFLKQLDYLPTLICAFDQAGK